MTPLPTAPSSLATRVLRDDRAVVRLASAVAAMVLGLLLTVPYIAEAPSTISFYLILAPGEFWIGGFLLHGFARMVRTVARTPWRPVGRLLWLLDAPLGLCLWLTVIVINTVTLFAMPAGVVLTPLCVAGALLFFLLHLWLVCGEIVPGVEGTTTARGVAPLRGPDRSEL